MIAARAATKAAAAEVAGIGTPAELPRARGPPAGGSMDEWLFKTHTPVS